MKKTILISILLLSSIVLHAQQETKESQRLIDRLSWNDEKLQILIDTRIDFRGDFPDKGEDEWGFQAQTIKLWLAGEIIPGITYRIRHRLNRPQNPTREGYSAATDHAWIAFDVGKKKAWNILVGKQSVQLGTFEYDYNPADVYLFSMVNEDFDGYKAGVNVAYKFLGQTINLQVTNADSPQFASDGYSRKALSANILWAGSLWDGIVRTRWGYGAFQHTKSKIYNWLTVGNQFNIRAFTTEVDYFLGPRNIDYSSLVGTDVSYNSYVMDQSLSINMKYHTGKFVPNLKFVWNKRYDIDLKSDAFRNFGVQAVLEYYPFKAKVVKDLRLHAMYYYSWTDFMGVYDNLSNTGTHCALVGLRWLFKAK